MVAQHYRWDFVGLSTDEKPTPATSEKVVDGSTFYCSDTSKLYVFCKDTWYERKALGGGGTTYTAGDGITIADDTISVDLAQATGTDTKKVMSQNATSSMIFADPGTDTKIKIGANATANGNNSISIGGGASTSNNGFRSVVVGGNAYCDTQDSIAIGNTANTSGSGSFAIAIGRSASASKKGAIALGAWTESSTPGVMNIGPTDTAYGYNSTNYRLLSGVHDPVGAHDAATKGYVDAQAGGGGGIKFLSASDFNYDDGSTGSFNTVAIWLLDDGFYFMPSDYTAVPVKGCLDGTNSNRFNSDVQNGGFFCFIKSGINFWMFVNMSNRDATIFANRPLYFCKVNRVNGWYTYEGGDQLALRSELSS